VQEHDVDVGPRTELTPGVRAEADHREPAREVEVLGDLVERRVERVRQRPSVTGAAQARVIIDPGPRRA
jgi:hypothetical protein